MGNVLPTLSVPQLGVCPIPGLRNWGAGLRGDPMRASLGGCGVQHGPVPAPSMATLLPENIPGRLAWGQHRGAGKGAFYGSVSALE